MKDLTIIVPVYNCESKVENAVNSIGKDINIIIINDGSTDCTKTVCQRLANRSNVILINTSNNGVSAARNIGLENVKTNFVMFLDSDDIYLNLEIFNDFQKYKSNLIIGSYEKISENRITKYTINKNVVDISRDMGYRTIIELYKKHMLKAVWNKIYDMNIIKEFDIKFNCLKKIGEDEEFNLKYLIHANNIVVYPDITYRYCVNNNGLHNKVDFSNIYSKIENCFIQKNIYSNRYYNFFCNVQLLKRLYQFIIYFNKNNLDDNQKKNMLNLISTNIEDVHGINYLIMKYLIRKVRK